jgi:hypothetical protein
MTYAEIRQIAKTGNAECERRCPFLKNSADIGVGIIIDCDHVCWKTEEEYNKFLEELKEGYEAGYWQEVLSSEELPY